MRIAISYGRDDKLTHNVEDRTLIRPIFGLHHVGTKANRLAVFGRWLDYEDARGVTGEGEIICRAKAILASIDDRKYEWLLTEQPQWRVPREQMKFGRSLFTGLWGEVNYEDL